MGINDIDFEDCLKNIILSNNPSWCTNVLNQRLGTFSTHLRADLNTLTAHYPDAPIKVMDYYNPFPPPPVKGQNACGYYNVISFVRDFPRLAAAWEIGQVTHSMALFNQILARDARAAQTAVYNDVQTVLTRLNATINSAAAGQATTVSTANFAGHDICAPDNEWVFAPGASVLLSLPHAKPIVLLQWPNHNGVSDVCPDPGPDEWNFDKSLEFFGVTASVAIGGNCFPHPTAEGQAAIASDFR